MGHVEEIATDSAIECKVCKPSVLFAKELIDTVKHEPAKMNCWEYKKCGRQPGGEKVEELGFCPAAIDDCLDGFHGGKNGGRACWAVAGTLCGGKPSGTFARKIKDCSLCEFHQKVMNEEANYQSAAIYIQKIKNQTKKRLSKKIEQVNPNFLSFAYARSKHVYVESVEDTGFDSLFITFLIMWVSMCPSISMLENSSRLCKDELVEELILIGAYAKHPHVKATKVVAKTMFKAVKKQIGDYFKPLIYSGIRLR
ncbi:MAG: hypothetical protein L3V56_12100 [Candidatus Magnetoovum sp. WYHC-5]|nr:hypothetical protein [Candidatus Magnetoovum sp. WYHC-5]